MLTTKSVFLVLDSAKVALHESEFRIILIYLHLDLPMSETSQIWLVAPCKQKIDHKFSAWKYLVDVGSLRRMARQI